jgi:CHAD domain-containing protein
MNPTSVVEIERKYDVGDGTLVPPLQGLPRVVRVDPPVEHRLEARYFDTEDLALASRRITLRRRTGGDDEGWHLKLPSSPDERHEYREPLGGEDDGVPEPLLTLIRVHTRDNSLVPVVRLRTRRTVYRLRGGNDSVLAEFSDDRVKATVLAPKRKAKHWREWELELVDGSRDLLDAAQGLLAAAGVRPAGHASKLARALGPRLHAGSEAPPPKRKAPAGDVLLSYLREQVQALKNQDPRVRLDAPGSIHGMRVATRRMRSVLATYRRLLADVDAVNSLRQELKWLAGVLGEARDAEVMHQRLKEMLAGEPAELVMGPVARRIDLRLGGEYQKAHTAALEALNSQRYFRLLDALEALLADPALTPLASKGAHKVFPDLIERDVRRLRRAVRDADRGSADTGDDTALHEARKDAKRLRYGAEAAVPVHPGRAGRLADAAHGVQKILGDHQDSVVTRELLRRLGAEAYLEGENGFSYGRLHALEQCLASDVEARFARQWTSFRPPSLRK